MELKKGFMFEVIVFLSLVDCRVMLKLMLEYK